MKLGIMQPYFFPYLGYFQLLDAVDRYVIYDDVNYIKGGWINRNKILLNGVEKMINVQLNGASKNKLINQVEIMGNDIYNKKLLKTIEAGYKKAPYFKIVFPLIEYIITYDERNLALYLKNLINEISSYLLIKTDIILSSDISKNNELKGQEKVIEICKVLNADEYYNSIGGENLYSYKEFERHNIRLRFLKSNITEYKQYENTFIPNLSVIDVLMFNSVQDIRRMIKDFELL